MILGILCGVASIVLIALGETKIGGVLTLSLIPATIAYLEWRCRERPLHPRSTGRPKLPALLEVMNSLAMQGSPKASGSDSIIVEALPTPLDIRINIPPNSPRSK